MYPKPTEGVAACLYSLPMRFISSSRDVTLLDWMSQVLPTAVRLDLVTGYLSASGLNLIGPLLTRTLEPPTR